MGGVDPAMGGRGSRTHPKAQYVQRLGILGGTSGEMAVNYR